jgi:hypothetical protein
VLCGHGVAPVSSRWTLTGAGLAQYLNGWLRDVVRPNLAPATVANYDMFVRLYIVPDLGTRKLEKLTVRDVQTWLNALRTRCQCCAQRKDAERPVPGAVPSARAAARSPRSGRCIRLGLCSA